jgi:hypothetical protein
MNKYIHLVHTVILTYIPQITGASIDAMIIKVNNEAMLGTGCSISTWRRPILGIPVHLLWCFALTSVQTSREKPKYAQQNGWNIYLTCTSKQHIVVLL